MSLSSKAVELAQEIDTSFLTLSQKNALTGVQRDIDHCKLVFKETSAAATAAATAQDFKIECFMSLSSKAVELAQEIDTSFLTLSQKNALTGVQRDINHCKLVFKETSAAATAAATAQAHPAKGPVWTYP